MSRKRTITFLFLILSSILFVSVVSAQKSINFELAMNSFAAGGGERQSSNHYVQDIFGQWVSGRPTSENHGIVTDFFWEGDSLRSPIYLHLPMVLNSP